MRRGLSVVQGGVGVGKTTISRKLIQLFDDESDIYDFYLILDPKFESELSLLQHLIELFEIDSKGDSLQDCRNVLEHHLLKVGVEQGKILVLIIDEGQNLESKYLDALRTLLNFETDDYKLVQLIIFGQPEMGSLIKEYPNFEDRISFHYDISPLDLDDTRGFIFHRLSASGAPENNWFPDTVIEKIHKQTNGFPRKINKLCHELLLYMISENKEEIDSNVFDDVLAGKPPKGLLKKQAPKESTVSSNKLLNVLRKNAPEPEPEPEMDGDDWIGGEAPSVDTKDKDAITTEVVPSDDENLQPNQDEDKPEQAPIQQTIDSNINHLEELPESQAISGPVVRPGLFPDGISPHIFLKEESVFGIAVDGNKIVAVSLQDHRKTKRLIDVQVYEHPSQIDFIKDPEEASKALKAIIKMCEKSVTHKDFLTKKIIKTISTGSTIALSIHSHLMQLKNVTIPQDSQGDKKNIIAWNAKKQLSYDVNYLQYEFVNQGQNKETVLVGITNRQMLNQTSEIFTGKDWAVRWWHPVAMSIHNAFLWNYSELSRKTCFVLHFGENESYLLGYSNGLLRAIQSISIGTQQLDDATIDFPQSDTQYRVPPSLLPGKAKPGTALPIDDLLRPILESWTRELDRTLTSLKRDFPVTDATHLLLSGTANCVKNLHRYLGGHLNMETEYFNPLRNIAILPDESERAELNVSLPLLTAAVGSALNLPNTVNLLPPVFKQSEAFRLMVKGGIRVAAILLISLFSLTGWTYNQNSIYNEELKSVKKVTTRLEPIKDFFYSMDENKNSVKVQLNELSYDTEYFERVLATLRFLSYNTPDEITYDEVRFQMGWEKEDYVLRGNQNILTQVIEVVDKDVRVLKISGTVLANPALKERYFKNYLRTLEQSQLFTNVEVITKQTEIGFDVDGMTFLLKCIM
ncbi:MAG: AAA family ATPase [Candidatus Marinimicrobia bacterium]|nr:AAA family ATPase [Candidatus Neomarinimicrobiota bacterium]